MLTELHTLTESLDRFGIAPAEVHPWVKPLSKGDFLIANIDQSAAVQSVEIKGDTDAASIPKIQKDNQNAFPSFKLTFPLVEIDSDAELRKALKDKTLSDTARASLIRKAMATAPLTSADKNSKRLGQLVKFSAEVNKLLNPALEDSPAVSRLLGILHSAPPSPQTFLRNMIEGLLAALERGENASIAQLVLIGDVNRKGKIEPGEISLVLDVHRAPTDEFARVAHVKTGRFYSKALLQNQQGKPDGVCAISGQYTALERGNLPSPRLQSLADTILFSANPDIACLQRYRMTGSEAFPIGRDTAQKLNNAALWITNTERKGKTWSTVPRSEGSGHDLLLAYVDIEPDVNAEIAELLSSQDGAQREGVFEAKAGTLINALDALKGRLATAAVLHTLVLRRISKGQVQVEFTRQFEVRRVTQALREWKEASSNTPHIGLMVPTEKGKPAKLIGPQVLFPGEIMEATKWLWIRGGKERQPAPGIALSTIYDLFLGQGAPARLAAQEIIGHVLKQSTPLLTWAGDQLARFGPSVREMDKPARYSAVRAAALLSLTLYKLERKKEVYMNETAFLLGRMLALSDTLHAQYCQAVRGGDLPPQLLGNQHYQMATDHPQRALAVLSERLRVYLAWAKTARADGDLQAPVRIARWALAEMGPIAEQLHGKLPERLKDADKAEMVLGYLARERKTEDKND